MKLAGVMLLVAVGCGKHSGGSAVGSGSAIVATANGSAAGSATSAVGLAGSAVGPAGSATGSGSAANLPPLGPSPTGMDATAAAGCDHGDAAACVAAARSFEPKGGYRADLPPKEADRREAGTALYGKRACDLGNGEGCALAAQFGHTYDLFERACDLGYAGSCGTLGCGPLEGDEKKADLQRDAALCEKACRADAVDWRAGTMHHGGFCHELYEAYVDKLGDKTKAAEILKLACAQGDKVGCPCKADADCGEQPADEGGGGFQCGNDHTCEIMSSD